MKQINFEQELYNRFGQVKDFTLGMRIAKSFYEQGANYVLEQIGKQLDEFSNFEDSIIVKRVIEQLKK